MEEFDIDFVPVMVHIGSDADADGITVLAAVCGAATLAIVALTVRRHTDSDAAAVIAAGALGLSATFWVQSTTANIRSLAALLTALCVLALLYWDAVRTPRSLALFTFLRRTGLPVCHCIGVRPFPFSAHAWTECHGRVVHDDALNRNRFTIIARIPK